MACTVLRLPFEPVLVHVPECAGPPALCCSSKLHVSGACANHALICVLYDMCIPMITPQHDLVFGGG